MVKASDLLHKDIEIAKHVIRLLIFSTSLQKATYAEKSDITLAKLYA